MGLQKAERQQVADRGETFGMALFVGLICVVIIAILSTAVYVANLLESL